MTRRPRRLAACALALAPAACSQGSEPPSGSAPRALRIAVVPKGTNQDFWKACEKGARRADAELDDVEIVWKGPQGEGDAAQQVAIVESFLAGKVDAICLAPLDARALEVPVRQAVQRGVPVILFDSGLASPDAPVASTVATDNRRGGAIAARRVVELLGGKGSVIVMPYAIGSESTEQRERGFLEEIARHPGIVVLSSDKHGGPDESRAIETGESLLATFGDRVDAIFCSNESSTSGMLTVLRRDPRGLAGRVKLVGFDSSANLAQGLADGVLHGAVLQDPVGMTHRAVKAARAKLRGEPVEARIETGETLATPENLGDPRIRELLFPLEGK
jgi:ribose transport system substrate-binding protein